MVNEELIELRNKLILGVSVALVITVPFLFFFITRYSNIKSNVYKAYRTEKTFVIYVTDSSCDKCSMVKNKLKNLDVEYIEYDLSKSKLFPSFHQNIAWKGQDRLRRTKSFQLRKSRMLDRKLRLKQRNSP